MAKQRYNYRQAMNQPYVFQEITDHFSFPKPQILMDWVIFVIVAVLMFLPFRFLTAWFSHMVIIHTAISYIAIPFVVLQVVKQFEPDGKKLYYYVFDYMVYFFRYQLHGYVIYKGRKIKREKELTVYQSVKRSSYQK